jgi:hypothetical protein
MGDIDLILLAAGEHHGRPHAPQLTARVGNGADGLVGDADSLLERLDRYLDYLEVHTGLKANRGMIARRALELFLETRANAEREPWTERSQ